MKNIAYYILIATVSLVWQCKSSYGQSEMLDKRFEQAGYKNYAQFSSFFNVLRVSINSDKKEEVMDLIAYPIVLNRHSTDSILINNSEEFVSYYDRVFSSELKEIILKTKPEEVFTSSEGVMLGSGDLWIANILDGEEWKTKIYAINTRTSK